MPAPLAWDSRRFRLDPSVVERITVAAGRVGVPASAIVRTGWAVLLARHLEAVAVRLRSVGDGQTGTGITLHEQARTFAEAARVTQTQLAVVGAEVPADSDPVVSTGGLQPTVEFRADRHDIGAPSPGVVARLCVEPADGVGDCRLEVDRAVVGPTTARLLAAELEVLLTGAAGEPDTPCSVLPILPDEDRRLLTEVWSMGADRPPVDCFTSLFDQQVARTPDRTALRDGEVAVTYAQLRERASAVAVALGAALARPARPGSAGPRTGASTPPQDAAGPVIGVMLGRGADFIAALLGALRTGAAFVPLDTRLPAEHLARVVERAGCAAVISRQRESSGVADVLALLDENARPVVVEIDRPPADRHAGVAVACCAGDALAYILFTSGSTGEPKGAMVEGRGMVNHMLAKLADLDIGPGDVVAQTGPPSFDIVVWQCLAPLLRGATVVVVPDDAAADPARLIEIADRDNLTVLQLVPAVLRGLVAAITAAGRRDRPPLPHLRWMVPTGDALPEDLCRQWFEVRPDVPMLNTYGSTECSDDQCHYPLHRWSPDLPAIVPIGRPIPGITAYVLDGTGEPVPIGVAGQLHIGGIGVGRGYVGQPELTRAVFVPDPFADDSSARLYRTGDKVRWRADGALDFLGRIDRTVKVRGHRIDVEEIERALRESADVYDCVVLTYAHGGDATDTRLVGYVVPDGSRPVDRATLRRHAQHRLPEHLRPAAYVLLDALPVNNSGKVDRRALKPVDERDLFDLDGEEMPGTDLEKEIAKLWSSVLGLARVPVDRTFIELGGHSLLATRLVLLTRTHFGARIDLADLFAHPTVRRMARFVAQAATDLGEPTGMSPRSDPEAAHEPFALTPLQEAYWVGRTGGFELGGVDAHVYLAAECTGMDLDRATDALRRLIQVHDALRLCVTHDGRQRVLPRVETPTRVEDLRGCPTEVVEERTRAVSERMAATGPDPTRAPALEIVVQILDGGRHRVHLSLALLVADGLSEHILLRDWIMLYRGEEPPHTVDLSYRDYVRAVLDPVSSGRDADWAYWRERGGTLPPAPELPVVDRMPERSGSFARRIARLDRSQWAAVKRRAADAGVTPTVTLLTLYAEVLAHWSRTPWFTVNVLSSWRTPELPQSEHITGNLSSTLPVEIDCRARLGFAERARGVQARLVADLAHGRVDGVRLTRATAQLRGWSSRAVFPVVFAGVLDVDTAFLAELPFEGTVLGGALQTPHVHLDHQIYEYAGALWANWDTVDSAFLPGTVDAAFEAYQRLLVSLDTEQAWQQPVSWSSLLPRSAMVEPVHTALSLDGSGMLHTAFFARAARAPAAVAVVDGTTRLTYADLAARATRIGRCLAQRGVGAGDLVPVVADKGWEQVAAVLGILHAGAAYLPIDASLPQRRIDHLLDQATAGPVLTQSWVADRLDLPGDSVRIDLADDLARLDPGPDPVAVPAVAPRRATPQHPAYVIYTSGSTGEPKGVEIDHRGAVNTVADVSRDIGLRPGDAILGMSSLSFDLSVFDIFGPLCAGATLVLPHRDGMRDPASWARLVVAEGITVWNSVPALMELLVDQVEASPPSPGGAVTTNSVSLRAVLLSGDWIPVTLPDRIRRCWPGADIVAMGGATEASIWSVGHRVGAIPAHCRSIPYGRAMTNQRMYVLDDAGEPRPVWAIGEIAIGGVGLARGYWRDPVRTAERFVRHGPTGCRLYRTGDLGRVLPSGDLEILGRDDLQVKINGYRIELGEIEATLLRHDHVRDAVVAVRAIATGGKSLVAYVVAADGHVDPDVLLADLAGSLPRYMVPASVECLPALPLTPNGKVDRQALTAAAAPAAAPATPVRRTTPRDEPERSLLALYREVLGQVELGVDDDFFTCGGNSFLAMRLVAAITARLDVTVPLSALLGDATVAGLARVIRDARTDSTDASPLVMIRQGGTGRPVFWVHPVGGATLCYLNLIRQLPTGRSCYGIQAYGLRPDEEPIDTIERMAAAYLAHVRKVQPDGPYLLGGWSMGGLVAFEMARQLAAEGARTGPPVLIDVALPDPDRVPTEFSEELLIGRMVADLTGDESLDRAGADRLGAFDLLRARRVLPDEMSEESWHRLFRLYAAHLRAIERYRPGGYDGPVRLIQAADRQESTEEPAVSWRRAGIDVTVQTVPGDHYTMWREDRHLAALTEAVGRHLAALPEEDVGRA